MEKKIGGLIEKWQIHHLTISVNKIRTMYPEVEENEGLILTGTVVDDPTGRWLPGHHMRSSIIVKYDTENGVIETLNTIYQLQGESGDSIIGGDIGDAVLSIFY